MSVLSDNLKYYRKKKGLTQKQLEKIAGVAQTAITKYENGKWNPKKATLISIADALEIPFHVLLIKRDDEEYTEPIYDNVDEQEYPYIEYMDAEQEYEEFQQMNNAIASLYGTLTKCEDYIPHQQFKKVISSINAILEQYKNNEYSPIQQTVKDFSDFYNKLTPNDFEKINDIAHNALENHSSMKYLKK